MNNQTLIADSGSTKTLWALGATTFQTQGINPIHQDDDTILAILTNELLPQFSPPLVPPTGGKSRRSFSSPSWGRQEGASILFYGSGVRPDQEARMERLLRQVFPQAQHIEARSDLLGAARALCGHQEGLACILGTGANSCLYDGTRIVANTPPLGYILGDEGSGAVLGIRFLNALYKGSLYDGARHEFEQHSGLALTAVIDRVYRQPLANRWLASLAPYIHERLHHPAVEALVVQNFRDFIVRNVQPYRRPDLPLHAVGSIAHFFRPQLTLAAQQEGYVIGRILRHPLETT